MKKIFLALILGTILTPATSYAHDNQRRWDAYGRGDPYAQREARPGDPGYYCHRHERKIHKDDVRRHCHSIYNDDHGVYANQRRNQSPWWRRW